MSISSFTIKMRNKYKLILLGDQSVGKTCLIEQFVNARFEESDAPTVGIDFVVTNIHHRNRQYRLQLWDTAGQERFKSLIPSYLRDSNCVLIVYDLSNRQSYLNVTKWLDMYRQNTEQNSLVVVVGNKCDLKSRFETTENVRADLEKHQIELFEVSAKTGHGIRELFNRILDLLQQRQQKPILDAKILETDEVDPQLGSLKDIDTKIKLTVRSSREVEDEGKENQIRSRCC